MSENVDFSGVFIDVAIGIAMRFDVNNIREAVRNAAQVLGQNHPKLIYNPPWIWGDNPPPLSYRDAVLDYVVNYNFPLNSAEAKLSNVDSLLVPVREELIQFYGGFQSFKQHEIRHVLYMLALYEAVTLIISEESKRGVKAVFRPIMRFLTVSKRLEVPFQLN